MTSWLPDVMGITLFHGSTPDADLMQQRTDERLRRIGMPQIPQIRGVGQSRREQYPSSIHVDLPPEPAAQGTTGAESDGTTEVENRERRNDTTSVLTALRSIDPGSIEPCAAERQSQAPRIAFEPKHALLCITILVCALAASLTLLIQQASNHASLTAASTTIAPTTTANQSTTTPSAEPSAAPTVGESSSTATTQPDEAEQASCININTAGSEELQQIKGIGPATAEKIIDHRTHNGAFHNVDDLVNVSGIGIKTVEKIRPWVCAP